jgi:hypothetical protein
VVLAKAGQGPMLAIEAEAEAEAEAEGALKEIPLRV